MNVTIKELMNMFPFPIDISEVKIPLDLPNYMGHRAIFLMNFQSVEFISILLRENEQFNIQTLKKQLSQYYNSFRKNCAFILINPSSSQLNSFLRNLVPFITNTKQIFLPFMGIELSNIEKKEKLIKSDFMMPATQQLFLYMFYNQESKFFLKSDIAKNLGLSKTSMTRAADQLINMKIITQTKFGKEWRMELNYSGTELYNNAKDHLINPIYDEFYIDKDQLPTKCLIAGESALSINSMITEPAIPCYAVYKKSVNKNQLKIVDIRWDNVTNPVKLQLWKYPPKLFAKNNLVDMISLICSLSQINDERIEGEIEDILRQEKW